MSIEALKAKARTHEQKEEWRQALDQYRKAIERLEEEGSPDIGLYNRVGDLFVRVEDFERAVEHFDRAVDLYVEAELHNNAIAVCKKIIRHVPNRHNAYLRIGQIRAQQGFLPDARSNFLRYAEKVQKAGDIDESLRALVEFCDLSPDEIDMRLAVADQLASHQRPDEALDQYAVAYRNLVVKGETDMARAVQGKARQIDPSSDLEAAAAAIGAGPVAAEDDSEDAFAGFTMGAGLGESDETEGDFELSPGQAMEEALEESQGEEEEVVELPVMDFSAEGEEEVVELPMMDFSSEDEGGETEAAGELARTGEMGEIDLGIGDLVSDVERAMEEEASEAGAPAKEPLRAKAPPAKKPPPSKPAPSGGDFVDFGSMVLGDKEEKSTRFVVDYEEPTGDEEADFARMLSQFKNKVSESLDADDVKSHHDLGTAYKEMGLLDEAVGEFQAALRASADHLPTYELLGQTFMEMGKPDAAARSLQRALQVPHEIEDELVGIYYHLARAFEDLGDAQKALDYYDRVFALDINFADVTQRLRALRPS